VLLSFQVFCLERLRYVLLSVNLHIIAYHWCFVFNAARTNAVNEVHQTAGRSVSCQMRCDDQTKFDRPWSPEPIVISYLDAILLWKRDHRSHVWYQFETAWITWKLAHAEVWCYMLHPSTLGYLMSRSQYLQIIGRSSDLLCCLSISAPRSCNNINLPNFENFQLSHSISSFCFQRSPWFKFLHREQLHLSPSANQ
jgi:hypothetical protein